MILIPQLEKNPRMAKFKVIISDPEAGKSNVVELEEARAAPLIGRRIGEAIDGAVVNLAGHKLQIMGGSDKDGFPMRPSVHGGVRRRVVLSAGAGFRTQGGGFRRRKTVRGNVITDEIVQLNMKIIEKAKGAKEAKPPKEKEEKTPQKEVPPKTQEQAPNQTA